MDFALSSRLFVGERLNSHVLDQVLAAGIRQIEIFAARQHLDYYDRNQVRDVAQWFTDHGVALHSVHAPLYSDTDWGRLGGLAVSLAYLERRLRIDSMDEVKRAIEIAERLPFRYLVVHLGLPGEEDEHLMPFEGGIDWAQTVRDFRTVDGQFPVLFELRDYGPDSSGLARLREAIDRMEAIQ